MGTIESLPNRKLNVALPNLLEQRITEAVRVEKEALGLYDTLVENNMQEGLSELAGLIQDLQKMVPSAHQAIMSLQPFSTGKSITDETRDGASSVLRSLEDTLDKLNKFGLRKKPSTQLSDNVTRLR